MSDSIVLVSAVLASLAAGVLVAYGVCLGMFRIFQMHAAQPPLKIEATSDRMVPGTAQALEG